MLAGPAGGGWASRAGARKPFITGLAFLLATALLMVFLPLQGIWGLAVISVAVGAGLGFYFAAAPNLIIEATPPQQQGITTGMWSVVGAIASAVATAILTAFFVANPLTVKTSLPGQPDRVTTISQLNAWSGYLQGFYVALGVAVVGLVITLLMKHGRTPSTGGAASEVVATPSLAD
jgi:MFS family permease